MTNIFISHPSPFNKKQSGFLNLLEAELVKNDFNPVNLGKSNWNYRAPLSPIKELMLSCKGALIIGLERSHSYIGYEREKSEESKEYLHRYHSSAWIQIEAGMAYQAGIPLLIFKEDKLYSEGILDPKVSEFFVFEFSLEKVHKSLPKEMKEMIHSWITDINMK